MAGGGLLGRLVPLGLPRRGEQDERGRIGRLCREGEVQEDEGIGVELERPGCDEAVVGDPDDDDDRLPDDVAGSPEEAGDLLGEDPKTVAAEGPLQVGVLLEVTVRVADGSGDGLRRVQSKESVGGAEDGVAALQRWAPEAMGVGEAERATRVLSQA